VSSPPAPLDLLRLYVDDVVPLDNSSEPQFTDDELNSALANANNNPQVAAVEVWKWKAAQAAAMVNVTEGNASRNMSDLQGQALAMIKVFENSRVGPTDGRTTIGKIRRRRF
jgi:hypothetical protein